MSTLFFLDVVGPADVFRSNTARPSDPEVFYQEETKQRLPGNQAAQTAVAMTQAAVDRFTATAAAAGLEVRVRETPESHSDIIEAIIRDNPPGRE